LVIQGQLSRLGDDWLGNPFTALAGLIPAPSMADVSSLTPEETMENMLYHFLDVSIPIHYFICITNFSKDFQVPLYPCKVL
jgi:hypothetical protein